jgi:hypothetical protein
VQDAINSIADGGIIEFTAGTYNAPIGGFTIYGGTKGFTMRAASGAAVSLNGQGATDILRFTDSTHPMTFERLTFINGATQNPFIGGALTLVNVQARFVSCTFQNNSANAGTGGGVLWIAASGVVFQDCTFDGNSSSIYGGAMSASDGSRVFVSGSRFTNNRTNLPGHVGNSAGGAIYGVDSYIQVSGSAFDNNQTGYAGGAIYLSGAWDRPVSQLLVSDCKFTGNLATRDPSVTFAAAAVGGAIHTETQADTKLTRCRFIDNVARQGGAVSIFQSIVQIDSCVFKGNRASGTGNEEGFGGTIMALSSPDNQGRRPISITATDTVFDGGGGTGAREGACIFAGGDLNAAFGLNGTGQNGSIESNRGTVRLTRVAITNFSAVAGGGLPGQGGAILGAFANVIIDDSIISNCSATDSGAGLQLIENSTTTITNSVIAGCSAATGAAITMFGGDLNASSTSFLANQVPGGARGAALTTAPSAATGGLPDFDIRGTIQNCKFAGNSGSTVIYDGDRGTSPFNRLQYSTNEQCRGSSFRNKEGSPRERRSDHFSASRKALDSPADCFAKRRTGRGNTHSFLPCICLVRRNCSAGWRWPDRRRRPQRDHERWRSHAQGRFYYGVYHSAAEHSAQHIHPSSRRHRPERSNWRVYHSGTDAKERHRPGDRSLFAVAWSFAGSLPGAARWNRRRHRYE